MPIRGRPVAREADKKFIFVTPDGWNYRLIDISDIETADQLRMIICYNLGIQDSPDVAVHMTGPGQTEHDEALNDSLLMGARSRMADPSGSLKLYVRAPHGLGPPPESAGLGLHLPKSPFGNPQFSNKPLDEATYARLTEGVQDSSTLRSNESTLVPEKFRNLQNLQKDGDTQPSDTQKSIQQETMLQHDFASLPEAERLALLEAKAEEHRKETDRKQKAYLAQRRNQLSHEGGKRIHDFDTPRSSPYDTTIRSLSSEALDPERKTDVLVPMRRAPPVPEPTSTLVKANSLTKKTGVNARTSWPNRKEEPWKRISSGSIPEEDSRRPSSRGIGAALIGAGKLGGMVGAPNSAPGTSSGLHKSSMASDLLDHHAQPQQRSLTSVGFNRELSGRQSPSSPRSPFTMSKGGQSFKIPEYDENEEKDEDTLRASQRPNLSLRMPSNPALQKVKEQGRSHSPDVSPSTAHPPSNLSRMSSRRSYGPSFDIPDKPVAFSSSPAVGMGVTESDSDEDSDDGLFAKPLANQKKKVAPAITSAKAQQVLGISSGSSQSASRSPSRPDLKLKTSRASVRFAASNQSEEESAPKTFEMERHVPASASSTALSAESPDESSRFGRRESFASDVWANRPPAEALVEHLDEFFPNVDLDQPMDEAPGDGSTDSPSTAPSTLSTKASSTDLNAPSRSVTPMSSADENDTLGSNESTLKRADQYPSVAHRNVRKSGGLGRTKSIRDVVKGAYQMEGRQQQPSTSSYASSRASGGAPAQNPLLNRVSTLRAGGGDIMRRKSTKMFGARIEQIKPSRGSRLINLETIPQDTLPPSSVQYMKGQHPERQPTFKWMRGQLIGKGTFGRVYLGMNTTTGELLAVKQVEVSSKNADPAKIREMVKALDQEIDTMQHLDHVNIVQYLGCEKKEFSISIFLEYISGGSVGSCLRKHGKFEEPVVSSLTRQTLCGLAYLHGQGILHRDLKADNILLDLDGTCKISDFGISKRSADAYINDITNSMQGSVFWMAPEVIRAQSQALLPSNSSSAGMDTNQALNQGYSAKVDIWSLGCVVLEMFAGRRPWSKEEAIGAIYKLGSLNQAPPIPDDVSRVVGPAALSFMYDCFTM